MAANPQPHNQLEGVRPDSVRLLFRDQRIFAPVLIGRRGRRPAYCILCLLAMVSSGWFYLSFNSYGVGFLVAFSILCFATGAFNGWLPLYLPELFPTSIRATGQGLSFNAGRVAAAVGSLFMGQFVALFDNHYGHAAATVCFIYALGAVLIWFAPETKGKPLPE